MEKQGYKEKEGGMKVFFQKKEEYVYFSDIVFFCSVNICFQSWRSLHLRQYPLESSYSTLFIDLLQYLHRKEVFSLII